MSRNRWALVAAVLPLSALLSTTLGCGRSPEAKAEAKRLPEGAYRVEWTKIDVPPTMAPGAKVAAHVTLKNAGNATWPDPPTADTSNPGAYAVRLSYRWWPASGDGKPTDWQPRVELPAPLPAGASVTLTVPLRAPTEPGDYKLQFDLVQELIVWFEAKGADKAFVPVSVR